MMLMKAVAFIYATADTFARAAPGRSGHTTEGLVDLGYAKHVPTSVNTTTSGHKVSIYKNIRFANAPTGDLRFRHPNTDLPTVDEIQDGDLPPMSLDCISSAPQYIPFPDLAGKTWGQEDCLFLDVYVPEGVKAGDDVPVLHFFVGSAYAFGSKDHWFSPMGLFEHMFQEYNGKFIFVANNYRLGVSGFTYSEGAEIDANIGIYDCLAAAEWTSKYIHKFGGDGQDITVSGQSAGAGMIYYMSALNGGEGELPFKRGFLSSIAAPGRRNVTERQTELYNLVLDAANCTSTECLRSLSEDQMLAVNDKLINQMPTTSGGGVLGPVIGFGPAPDGNTIPDHPLALFQEGRFHKEIDGLVLGSMALEGKGTSHEEDQPAYFPIMVRQILSTASNETVSAIQSLYDYPPDQPEQLAWDWTTDAVFACNAYNLAQAMPETSRRYIMSAPPATHGADQWYFFYVNEEETPLGDHVPLAREFQTKLLDFVYGRDGDWPVFGDEMDMFNITNDGFEATTMPDELRERCDTINNFVLDPANGV